MIVIVDAMFKSNGFCVGSVARSGAGPFFGFMVFLLFVRVGFALFVAQGFGGRREWSDCGKGVDS